MSFASIRFYFIVVVVSICQFEVENALVHFNSDKAVQIGDSLNILLNVIDAPLRVNALVCWDLGKSNDVSQFKANTFINISFQQAHTPFCVHSKAVKSRIGRM